MAVLSLDFEEELLRILPNVRKPARYSGGEWNQVVKSSSLIKTVLAFPDVYEVGMSNIGLQILYEIINRNPDYTCERAFAPWPDMEAELRKNHLSLFSLENKRPLKDFDVIGFSLQYELNFSNVLNMIDLSGLALISEERAEDDPLIIAGGPTVFNPEPMADFIDAFIVGEGEEVIVEVLAAVAAAKDLKIGRRALLRELSRIEGVYIPCLYDRRAGYPLRDAEGEPVRIKKRLIKDFDRLAPPRSPVMPYLETIHDRCVIEVMRGCTRGCRFCQAGIVYRPTRERPVEAIAAAAARQIDDTGYDELSLSSLSTSDHSEIVKLLEATTSISASPGWRVSLPSLRTDMFSVDLASSLSGMKKTGLTFAPEAGTARLRRVINKGLTEEDIIGTALKAFEGGWQRIKLYFMIGLPTETDEDVVAIAALVEKILAEVEDCLGRKSAKRIKITVSVSSFIPKSHSPFQWARALTPAQIRDRQRLLRDHLSSRRTELKWHDAGSSHIEAALARGGREMGPVIARAFELGARFDGWSDSFDYDLWLDAFRQAGVDIATVANDARDVDAALPWDHIDSGVTKRWLTAEYRAALDGVETSDCRQGTCSQCGVCRGDIRLVFQSGVVGDESAS